MGLKLYLFLLLFPVAFSASSQSTGIYIEKPVEYNKGTLQTEVYGDYSTDDFRWSIAGNSMGQNPNILSEVKWKNIKGPGMGLDIRWNIWSPIFLKGSYHRTFIKSGLVSDTDYAADNRQEPGYQASLNSNEGFIYTYVLATGYEFTINPILKISPYAGYLKNSAQLHLKDFEGETDPAIKTLNSVYQARWTGLTIGAEANILLSRQFSVKGIIDYRQMKYRAIADWNLIDAFAHPVSFKHTANGYGAAAQLQVNFRFSPLISTFIRGNYSYANTGKGTDDLFLADGRQLQSQFNEAVSHTGGIGIGVGLAL
ncbi:hypothetical protein TH53_07260 [Pedobacter lusitanus]|uniref:Protochlamydia outer membrane protein domain-containing protein n=1 Tax=Pedobacter lusitanus TaxID=1503925 RepID=A0A0D0GNI0_9SPHI|nr:hypothetical protein [Pedobacter lusitanus]KIO77730.1 hypothetical protein TH53_07260 [Pedobacter lusitanus]